MLFLKGSREVRGPHVRKSVMKKELTPSEWLAVYEADQSQKADYQGELYTPVYFPASATWGFQERDGSWVAGLETESGCHLVSNLRYFSESRKRRDAAQLELVLQDVA